MNKLLLILLLFVGGSLFAQDKSQGGEALVYQRISCDGRSMMGWMGIMGEEKYFVILDSVQEPESAFLAFDVADRGNPLISAYHEDYTKWARESCKKIISKDAWETIKKVYRDNSDTDLLLDVIFDDGGKVISVDLLATMDLYRELTRETLARMVFHVKDLQVPFTRYYDFGRKSYRTYARTFINVRDVLRNNGELTGKTKGIVPEEMNDCSWQEITCDGQTMNVWMCIPEGKGNFMMTNDLAHHQDAFFIFPTSGKMIPGW